MSTKNPKIRIRSMVGGILLLAYAIYVKVTGKFIIHTEYLEYLSLFAHKSNDLFMYYVNLVGSSLLGIVDLYRSLLFLPSNKKYWDEHPEYLKKRAELFKSDMKIDFGRLSKVTLVIFLIFGIIMLISKFL